MAEFFLARHRSRIILADAPKSKSYLTRSDAVLTQGKVVFAERCARCHSSKAPAPAAGVRPRRVLGSGLLEVLEQVLGLDQDRRLQEANARNRACNRIFWTRIICPRELRVPVTLLQTNACSPLASNAIGGSIWDNFSSQTYKDLPSVGEITYYDPDTGEPHKFKMPAGGRGYTRPPSLVSLWSTSPFLLNNSVGPFNPSPAVADRMSSFDKAIRQMLWPETRDTDPVIGKMVPGPSHIDRTTAKSYIKIPSGFLPKVVAEVLKASMPFLPSPQAEGLQIGPIPEGTAVALLANLDLDPGGNLSLADRLKRDGVFLKLVQLAISDLKNAQKLPDDQLKKNFANLTGPLMELSKCPDYIVNRGHYFGTSMLDPAEGEPGLSDQDKEALIAFLKRF